MSNRLSSTMYVTFNHPLTNEEEEISVYIPFDIFVEGLYKYCSHYCSVELDGKPIDVYNLFAEIEGALDYFLDQEEFMNILKEEYLDSSFYEEDFDDWKDDYDYIHDLGDYAPEEEED